MHNRAKYLSLYADPQTQAVFERFLDEKNISKTTALSQFMEIFMLANDADLYLRLKKEILGVDAVQGLLAQQTQPAGKCFDNFSTTDYGLLFRLTPRDGLCEEDILHGNQEIEHEFGYSWISFNGPSRGTGIHPTMLAEFHDRLNAGDLVPCYYMWGNTIRYSAKVLDIFSGPEKIPCPGDLRTVPEEFRSYLDRTWLKIKDLRPESDVTVDNLLFKNGSSVRSALSSRFVFGYVHSN